MQVFTCPNCHKSSYSADEVSFHPCPYCGFKFSGKHGPEKRTEERTREEISLDVSYKGERFEARSRDFSSKGLSMNIFGEPSISEGDVLDFFIGDLMIKAKVIWLAKGENEAVAGLQKWH